MNVTENANLIEILRQVEWSDTEITDFQLGVGGRISVEEAANRIREARKKRLSAEKKEL